jgi:hypothetical protein
MRAVLSTLVLLSAAMWSSAQSDYHTGARDLIARVQTDLQRAAEFATSGNAIKIKKDEKQIERYRNAQRSASNFDRKLSQGKFDKGDLDDTINDLKNVVEHNTLQSEDRDALNADLRDLRILRAARE